MLSFDTTRTAHEKKKLERNERQTDSKVISQDSYQKLGEYTDKKTAR
jgi:hypothetical protein